MKIRITSRCQMICTGGIHISTKANVHVLTKGDTNKRERTHGLRLTYSSAQCTGAIGTRVRQCIYVCTSSNRYGCTAIRHSCQVLTVEESLALALALAHVCFGIPIRIVTYTW